MTVHSPSFHATVTTCAILVFTFTAIAVLVDVPAFIPLAAGMCIGLAILYHALKEGWYPR